MRQENKIKTKAFLGFVMALSALTAVAGTAWAGAVDLPPAWSQVLPGDRRFEVLDDFDGGQAVLDKETGLVWERSPNSFVHWFDANRFCYNRVTGRRFGWRLPTVEELASLLELVNPTGSPTLPAGHPFTNVQADTYWSATTSAADTSAAWRVDFFFHSIGTSNKFQSHFIWCVRGGQGHDGR